MKKTSKTSKKLSPSFRMSVPKARSSQMGGNGPTILQQVREAYTIQVAATGTGVCDQTVTIQPSGVLLAARLTAYRALADQVRLDKVKVEFIPYFGVNANGRFVMYVERDPTASVVSTVDLATDQREVVAGKFTQPLSICWRPQQPTDLVFNLLNPGTVSLGSIFLKGDSLTDPLFVAIANGARIGTIRVTTWMTLRGRP